MPAATMVTAGIYLLIRTWPLISALPYLPHFVMILGAFTCLFSAALAFTQKDIKRILAYSTVSHLGLMAFALGLGQVGAALFHLITHGFFKAALFLCAGNIAHGLGKSTATVDEVGGLVKRMPVTAACFWISALSLAGIWPLAGFFSKDAILDAAFHHGGLTAVAGGLVALGSALYIFRMGFLVFHGGVRKNQHDHHPHEADAGMAAPVAFITLGAISVGWLARGFERLAASGAMVEAHLFVLPEFSWTGFSISLALACAGALIAWFLTTGRPDWDWEWRASSPRWASFLAADLGWRWAVDGLASCFTAFSNWFADALDHDAWDGLIESTPNLAVELGQLGRRLASGRINDYLWWLVTGSALLLLAVLK
jgi:NADH-quinone oxidoreductase subunit L